MSLVFDSFQRSANESTVVLFLIYFIEWYKYFHIEITFNNFFSYFVTPVDVASEVAFGTPRPFLCPDTAE